MSLHVRPPTAAGMCPRPIPCLITPGEIMLRFMLNRWFAPRRPIRTRKTQRFIPTFIGLETRLAPAVTASVSNGVLSVFGDALDNTITVNRNAAGGILVNGGPVA